MIVTMIGSGNVATVLSKLLTQNGHTIAQVFSQHLDHAQTLADAVSGEAIVEWKNITTDSNIYILAIKDDVIDEAARHLRNIVGPNAIIAHTSGTKPLADLGYNVSVFYPLQSFTKHSEYKKDSFPILIQGETKAIEQLRELANSISKDIHITSDEKRKYIHIAAVFANNFTNLNFTIAQDILKSQDISFDILKPLIRTTIDKIEQQDPSEIQTGPAKRADLETIQKHLALLHTEFPEFEDVYDANTQTLLQRYLNS